MVFEMNVSDRTKMQEHPEWVFCSKIFDSGYDFRELRLLPIRELNTSRSRTDRYRSDAHNLCERVPSFL